MDKRIKLRSYKATSAPTYILVSKGSTEQLETSQNESLYY